MDLCLCRWHFVFLDTTQTLPSPALGALCPTAACGSTIRAFGGEYGLLPEPAQLLSIIFNRPQLPEDSRSGVGC